MDDTQELIEYTTGSLKPHLFLETTVTSPETNPLGKQIVLNPLSTLCFLLIDLHDK